MVNYGCSNSWDIMVRVIWEDWQFKYSQVTPSDLLNKFDITVDVDSLIEQTRLQRTQEAISLLQAIWPINNNPISNTPVINPESLIAYIAEQTWSTTIQWMTKEERTEYAKEQISILSEIEKAKQPQQTTPPIQQPTEWMVEPIDIANLQWFMW